MVRVLSVTLIVISLLYLEDAIAEEKYIGSERSDKYHLPGCEWAKRIATQNQIRFNTIAAAEAAGYRACSVCEPAKMVAIAENEIMPENSEPIWIFYLIGSFLSLIAIGLCIFYGSSRRSAKKKDGPMLEQTMEDKDPDSQDSSQDNDTLYDEDKQRLYGYHWDQPLFQDHLFNVAQNADLSNFDYLNLFFNVMLHQHKNHLSDMSKNWVTFYPGPSARLSLVMIVQSVNDKSVYTYGWFPPKLVFRKAKKQEREQMIIEISEEYLNSFKEICSLPWVRERWSIRTPSENILIRYIRSYSDKLETLAVTVDGKTYFDANGLEKAKARLESANGLELWFPDGLEEQDIDKL